MSNQRLPVVRPPVECSPPLVRRPLDADQAAELAAAYKALADPVRLRLLSLIAARAGGEVCVCDLTGEFDVTQPTISHHLKVLRSAGLIDCRRRATWVYYWVVPTTLERLAGALAPPGGGVE